MGRDGFLRSRRQNVTSYDYFGYASLGAAGRMWVGETNGLRICRYGVGFGDGFVLAGAYGDDDRGSSSGSISAFVRRNVV